MTFNKASSREAVLFKAREYLSATSVRNSWKVDKRAYVLVVRASPGILVKYPLIDWRSMRSYGSDKRRVLELVG